METLDMTEGSGRMHLSMPILKESLNQSSSILAVNYNNLGSFKTLKARTPDQSNQDLWRWNSGNSIIQSSLGGFNLQPSLKTTALKQKITTGLWSLWQPQDYLWFLVN